MNCNRFGSSEMVSADEHHDLLEIVCNGDLVGRLVPNNGVHSPLYSIADSIFFTSLHKRSFLCETNNMSSGIIVNTNNKWFIRTLFMVHVHETYLRFDYSLRNVSWYFSEFLKYMYRFSKISWPTFAYTLRNVLGSYFVNRKLMLRGSCKVYEFFLQILMQSKTSNL